MQSIILSVGGYLPEKVMTNDELSQTLDTSDEWITARTGIRQRHLADPSQKTSDLAVEAAQSALADSGLSPLDIDLILVATSTPDNMFPPCATRVQDALRATKAVAFDMNAACSGFLFALTVADAYIKQGVFRSVMVIGVDLLSRIVDWEDRGTAILFGDGAGALILQAAEEGEQRGLLQSRLWTDGAQYEQLYVCSKARTISMNGREVYRHAVLQLESLSRALLEEMGYVGADIDWVIPHQANKRIIDAVTERLGIPLDKALYAGHAHANTSAASIPLVLWKAWSEKKVVPGDLVLFQAFGAGFTGGALLARL